MLANEKSRSPPGDSWRHNQAQRLKPRDRTMADAPTRAAEERDLPARDRRRNERSRSQEAASAKEAKKLEKLTELMPFHDRYEKLHAASREVRSTF